MLKLKDSVNIDELTKIGFVSFKVDRRQTNYYFAVRRGGKVILINDVRREVVVDNICEPQPMFPKGDTRIHANIKWQPKNTLVEDGIFALCAAGLVERV